MAAERRQELELQTTRRRITPKILENSQSQFDDVWSEFLRTQEYKNLIKRRPDATETAISIYSGNLTRIVRATHSMFDLQRRTNLRVLGPGDIDYKKLSDGAIDKLTRRPDPNVKSSHRHVGVTYNIYNVPYCRNVQLRTSADLVECYSREAGFDINAYNLKFGFQKFDVAQCFQALTELFFLEKYIGRPNLKGELSLGNAPHKNGKPGNIFGIDITENNYFGENINFSYLLFDKEGKFEEEIVIDLGSDSERNLFVARFKQIAIIALAFKDQINNNRFVPAPLVQNELPLFGDETNLVVDLSNIAPKTREFVDMNKGNYELGKTYNAQINCPLFDLCNDRKFGECSGKINVDQKVMISKHGIASLDQQGICNNYPRKFQPTEFLRVALRERS